MSFCVSDTQPGFSRGGRGRGSFSKTPAHQYNEAEYLSWRRLHLSKSKLTNVAEMASFMAGFAVVGTVELQINDQDASPPLLTAFVITTALLVGTCMTAIIISTCVLPHLEAVARTSNVSEANQSPHDKMMRLIDISWILTNSASLFFFTLDIILMCWIKYTYFSRGASIAATLIMAPVLVIIIVFAILFYRRIMKHQYVMSSLKYEELEQMHRQLERTASLSSASYQGTITSNYQTVTSFNNQQWLQQNHPQYSPSAQSPSQSSQNLHQPQPQRQNHQSPPPPPQQQQRPHSHRHHHHHNHGSHKHSGSRRHHHSSRNSRHHNNNYIRNSPVFFSSNPNVHHEDSPRLNSPSSSEMPMSTKPLSPSWSDKSFSPSVFTV